MKQLIVGLEHELFADVSVQAQYIRRRFDTFMGLIDTGSIYAPTQLPDPGPGRRARHDRRRRHARRVQPDQPRQRVQRLHEPGRTPSTSTTPCSSSARKRYSRNWQLQGSYTWSKNRGTVGNRWHVNAARFDLGNPGSFVNPNPFINAYGRASFDPTHEVKVLGSYRLPWWGGTMVSGVYRYTTGQAWGRMALDHGACAGSAERPHRAAGHAARAGHQPPRLPRWRRPAACRRTAGTLGLFFDVFNLFNQGVPDSDVGQRSAQVSGARFGEPNAWSDPRMLRVGVRVTF